MLCTSMYTIASCAEWYQSCAKFLCIEGPGGYNRERPLHIQPWLLAKPQNCPRPLALGPSSVGQASLGFACAEDAIYYIEQART